MQGQGRGGGRGAGAGSGCGGGMGSDGFCFCPKCGKRFPHQQGVPCLDERCRDCGVALVREGSAHHQKIQQRRDRGSKNIGARLEEPTPEPGDRDLF